MEHSEEVTTFAERCAARARTRDLVVANIGYRVENVAPDDLLWVAEGVESGLGVISRSPLQILAETRRSGELVHDVLRARHLFIATIRDSEPDPALVVGFDDSSPANATCQAWFYARRTVAPDHVRETLDALARYTRANWDLRIVYLTLPSHLPRDLRLRVTQLGDLEGRLPGTAYARGTLWDEDIVALR